MVFEIIHIPFYHIWSLIHVTCSYAKKLTVSFRSHYMSFYKLLSKSEGTREALIFHNFCSYVSVSFFSNREIHLNQNVGPTAAPETRRWWVHPSTLIHLKIPEFVCFSCGRAWFCDLRYKSPNLGRLRGYPRGNILHFILFYHTFSFKNYFKGMAPVKVRLSLPIWMLVPINNF